MSDKPVSDVYKTPAFRNADGKRILREVEGEPFSVETELLLRLSKTSHTAQEKQQISACLDEEIDWDVIIKTVRRHRVVPLVYRAMRDLDLDAVPAHVREDLGKQYHAILKHNMLLYHEMLEVLDELKEHDVPAIPFKGPTLALRVYGDIALRTYGDIDLLLHRDDITKAKRLLMKRGYQPRKTMTAEQEEAHLDTQIGYDLVRVDYPYIVELHWSFLNIVHSFKLDPQSVWERAESVDLSGREHPTLSDEDLIIYLCAHGAKHYWESLCWICDIAELLRSKGDEIDWNVVLSRAARLKTSRMLYLGLRLAHELLGAPLPPGIAVKVNSDKAVETLKNKVVFWLFFSHTPESRDVAHRQFHIHIRERFADRIPYYSHIAKLAMQPTVKDHKVIRLPRPLHFVYYFIRAFRLMIDGLLSLVRKPKHRLRQS